MKQRHYSENEILTMSLSLGMDTSLKGVKQGLGSLLCLSDAVEM